MCYTTVISIGWCLMMASLAFGIKRIAVIGGGPGGLGLVAAIRKLKSFEGNVVLFEARDDILQPNLGGGLQLSGGAVVLNKLGALTSLQQQAEVFSRLLSRNAERDTLLELNLNDIIREQADNQILCDSRGNPMIFSIMRDCLQRILFDVATSTVDDRNAKVDVSIEPRKVCTSIEEHPGGKVSLGFADGSRAEDFDCVFGADGAGSTVRAYVGADTIVDVPQFAQQYSGIRISYAVTPPDNSFSMRPEPGSRGAFHQWFGDSVYVLVASYGGLQGIQHMMATIYRESTDAELGENPAWSSSGSEGGSKDRSAKAILRGRLERAGLLKNIPELNRLLEMCDDSRFIDLGFKNRPLPLKNWASKSGRVILVGDSAHVMPPFLGQGANQALQDAYFLADGLKSISTRLNAAEAKRGANMTDSKKTVVDQERTCREEEWLLRELVTRYEARRRPHTALLTAKSIVLGQIETLPGPIGSAFRDAFFRLTGQLGIASAVFVDQAKPRL